MFSGMLDHHRAELPHYRRVVKKKLQDAALAGASRAGKIKNEYVEAWKTHPQEMLTLTIAGAITGTSLGLAYVYRRQAKRIDKSSWVELLPAWEDAMLDRGAVLGMVIDGGQLKAKIFEREQTKY
jgi:hypothetical protein